MPVVLMVVKYDTREDWQDGGNLYAAKINELPNYSLSLSNGATIFSEILLDASTESVLVPSSEASGYFRIAAARGTFTDSLFDPVPLQFNWLDGIGAQAEANDWDVDRTMFLAASVASTAGAITTAAANIGSYHGLPGTAVSMLQDISAQPNGLWDVMERVRNGPYGTFGSLELANEYMYDIIGNSLGSTTDSWAKTIADWSKAVNPNNLNFYYGSLAATSVIDGIAVAGDLIVTGDAWGEVALFLNSAGQISSEGIIPRIDINHYFENGKVRLDLSADKSLVEKGVTGTQYTWAINLIRPSGSDEHLYLDGPHVSTLIDGDQEVLVVLSMSGYKDGVFFNPRPISARFRVPVATGPFDSSLSYMQFSDSRTVNVNLALSGITSSEISEVYIDFGDGTEEKHLPYLGLIPLNYQHTYSADGTYDITLSFLTYDGRMGVVTETANVQYSDPGESEPGDQFSPLAVRIEPETITSYVRMGETQSIRVRGSDLDSNLSHVVYSASDSELSGEVAVSSTSSSVSFGGDEDDDFDYVDEDTETVTVKFTDYNSGDPVYVYATVYDTAGKFHQVYWRFYIEPTFVPVLSEPSPSNASVLSLPLGEHDFSLWVEDIDDNSNNLVWYLNGQEVDTSSIHGGSPKDTANTSIYFTERDEYTLEARVVDDDQNKDSISWTIRAGFDDPNNNPPVITTFGPDREQNDDLPYELFRVGRGYRFEGHSVDVDSNLGYWEIRLDGETLTYYQDSDADRSDFDLDTMVFFPTAGQHELTFIVRDAWGEQVSQTITVDVQGADGTGGSAPSLTYVYPHTHEVWATGDFNFVCQVNDPDWDWDRLLVTIDGQVYDDGSNSFEISEFPMDDEAIDEFTIPQEALAGASTRTITITPIDHSGNKGTTWTWTVRVGQQGSHSPDFTVVDPDNDGVIYAKRKADGTYRAEFRVFASDRDGDLSRITVHYGGTDPSDESDYHNVSTYEGWWVNWSFSASPTRDGTITVTVTDSLGNSKQATYTVTRSPRSTPTPPQFVFHNFAPDGDVVLPSFAENGRIDNDDVPLVFDVYDPNGDLKSLKLYKGLQLLKEEMFAQNQELVYLEVEESLFSTGNAGSWFHLDLPRVRGEAYDYRLVLEDQAGNVTERHWNLVLGPWGSSNHSPVVDSQLEFTMEQRSRLQFHVNIFDEEGDMPAPSWTVPIGDEVRYLGNGDFEYQPDLGRFGDVSFDVLWDDGFGGTAITSVNVTISRVVANPVVSPSNFFTQLPASESASLKALIGDNVTLDGYGLDEVSVVELSSSNTEVNGSGLVTGNDTTVSLIDESAQGYAEFKLVDSGGRESNPFTVVTTPGKIDQTISFGTHQAGHGWTFVENPTGSFDAVVIAGTPTYHGLDPGVVRLQNVNDIGFDIRFQEWDYRQRDFGDNHHAVEDIPYLVLHSGRHTMSDGSVWEVGTFDIGGTGSWQKVFFNQLFTQSPKLFLTVQTAYGPQAVTARARNVTADGFEVALFEEEALMDGHAIESVGYLAIESSAGGGLIDLDGKQLPYLLQTLHSDHRWTPVLSHRLKVEEERSKNNEVGHVAETLHVLALGSQVFAQQVSSKGGDTTALRRMEPTRDAPIEWGLLRGVDHNWKVLPFVKAYTAPVVVAKAVSNNGVDPGVIRLQGVTGNQAEVRYQEWNYLDGKHAPEDLYYLVSETGEYSLGGLTVEADRFTTNNLARAGLWTPVNFNAWFDLEPAVFSSVMTYNGAEAVTTRISDLSPSGFNLAMDEQESKNNGHVNETLGWIALSPGSGATSEGYKLQVFFDQVNGLLTTVPYSSTSTHRMPTVLGDVDSSYGLDPVFLRYASPTNLQIEFKLTEEHSWDVETNHVLEDVGVFVGE